ncbi:hypothetical protein [Brachybacterium hainanense]|uniref:Uncharacterized protein n=1 Tax=Brachybacterium hainanense TaxID=1541174 RepID=A0ABV6RB43_9MICO
MTTSRIDPADHRFEQFLASGDKRQVMARRRDSGALVFLAPGSKDQHNAAELRCLLPNCFVDIILREGTKRLHYAHRSAPAHSGNAPWLFGVAAVLEAAVHSRVPEAQVGFRQMIDTEVGEGDVVLVDVDLPAGDPICLVVIAVNLTDHRLQELRGIAQEGGRIVQWVLVARLFRPAGPHGRVNIPDVAKAILCSQGDVLGVHAQTQLVGTRVSAGRTGQRPALRATIGALELCPITDLEVDPGIGIVTPSLRTLARTDEILKSRSKPAPGVASSAPDPLDELPSPDPDAVDAAHLENRHAPTPVNGYGAEISPRLSPDLAPLRARLQLPAPKPFRPPSHAPLASEPSGRPEARWKDDLLENFVNQRAGKRGFDLAREERRLEERLEEAERPSVSELRTYLDELVTARPLEHMPMGKYRRPRRGRPRR